MEKKAECFCKQVNEATKVGVDNFMNLMPSRWPTSSIKLMMAMVAMVHSG